MPAQAASTSTTYAAKAVLAPQPEAMGRWAERLATAGDLDGDGVADLIVGDPGATSGGQNHGGRVYAISGKSLGAGAKLKVLYQIESPEPEIQAQFGFAISVLGDGATKGRALLAVGTDAQSVKAGPVATCSNPQEPGCSFRQGKAWVFDAKDGRLLYALDSPRPQAMGRFGSRIGRAGDLNGDGTSEIVVGASAQDSPVGCGQGQKAEGCRTSQGQAFIFNGADGKLLRTLDLPTEDLQPPGPCGQACGSFGLSVQGPGDVNNDGTPDQAVTAGSYTVCSAPGQCSEGQGRIYVFSGKDGSVIHRLDDPNPQAKASFGFQDAEPLAPGDIDGDGFADIYANGFIQNGPGGEAQGMSWIFSGKTGKAIRTFAPPHPSKGGQFGWSLVRAGAGDKSSDLLIGSSPHHVTGVNQNGGTALFGSDGKLVRSLGLPAAFGGKGFKLTAEAKKSATLGPNLGWSIAAPGDLNGDGKPDYLAGAPFADVRNNPDEGVLFAFLSQKALTAKSSEGSGFQFPFMLAAVAAVLAGAVAARMWSRRKKA